MEPVTETAPREQERAPEPAISAPEPASEPSIPAPQPASEPASPPAFEAGVRDSKPFDRQEYLSNAGLQMVETRPDAAPVQRMEEERVQLGRPRRARPAPSQEESLVQVETRK